MTVENKKIQLYMEQALRAWEAGSKVEVRGYCLEILSIEPDHVQAKALLAQTKPPTKSSKESSFVHPSSQTRQNDTKLPRAETKRSDNQAHRKPEFLGHFDADAWELPLGDEGESESAIPTGLSSYFEGDANSALQIQLQEFFRRAESPESASHELLKALEETSLEHSELWLQNNLPIAGTAAFSPAKEKQIRQHKDGPFAPMQIAPTNKEAHRKTQPLGTISYKTFSPPSEAVPILSPLPNTEQKLAPFHKAPSKERKQVRTQTKDHIPTYPSALLKRSVNEDSTSDASGTWVAEQRSISHDEQVVPKVDATESTAPFSPQKPMSSERLHQLALAFDQALAKEFQADLPESERDKVYGEFFRTPSPDEEEREEEPQTSELQEESTPESVEASMEAPNLEDHSAHEVVTPNAMEIKQKISIHSEEENAFHDSSLWRLSSSGRSTLSKIIQEHRKKQQKGANQEDSTAQSSTLEGEPMAEVADLLEQGVWMKSFWGETETPPKHLDQEEARLFQRFVSTLKRTFSFMKSSSSEKTEASPSAPASGKKKQEHAQDEPKLKT